MGLTDAQKTCLAQHGITLPTPGASGASGGSGTPGSRPARPTGPPDQATRDTFRAKIEKYRAAADACNIKGPGGFRHFGPGGFGRPAPQGAGATQ